MEWDNVRISNSLSGLIDVLCDPKFGKYASKSQFVSEAIKTKIKEDAEETVKIKLSMIILYYETRAKEFKKELDIENFTEFMNYLMDSYRKEWNAHKEEFKKESKKMALKIKRKYTRFDEHE